MSEVQHHFGVDSQEQNTFLVFERNTKTVSDIEMTKSKTKTTAKRPAKVIEEGQYSNGLADALAVRPEITQAKLAKEVGTSQQQIHRLIHGQREMTSPLGRKTGPGPSLFARTTGLSCVAKRPNTRPLFRERG